MSDGVHTFVLQASLVMALWVNRGSKLMI